jgi:hypothetical protein
MDTNPAEPTEPASLLTMRRTRIRTLAAVSAVGATVALAAPSGAAADGCTPPGYAIEAKSSASVVVRKRYTERVYGCLRSHGRLIRLHGAIGGYAAAGRYVAYLESFSDPAGAQRFSLVVVNVATRNTRRAAPAYVPQPPTPAARDGETAATITDTALTRKGSVAWIACRPRDPNGGRCGGGTPSRPVQVWRADRRGRELLDSSDAIRTRSLRRHGRRISWRHDGATRHATLR